MQEVLMADQGRPAPRRSLFGGWADVTLPDGRVLQQQRLPRPAREHVDDPDTYANALTGTYATDDKYGKQVISLMRQHNLYQYDH